MASSEIYPTWPESALRANIYAQISFALNRIYTEFYRNQGYAFDITNSTAYDQSYVQGRDVFENISVLVDEMFNSYVRRQGERRTLFHPVLQRHHRHLSRLIPVGGTVALANAGCHTRFSPTITATTSKSCARAGAHQFPLLSRKGTAHGRRRQ